MGVKHISEVTRRDIATLFVDGYYDYSIYWPDSKDSSPDDAKIFYPYCGRLTMVDMSVKMDVLGSILSGKMVFENGKCRTAEFNPIIALLMDREPFLNDNGVSGNTETPLLYPEPRSK